jgi:hypothetical protein
MMASPTAGSVAGPLLTLFSGLPTQLTQVTQVTTFGFGSAVWITFTPNNSEDLYQRVQSIDGRVIGTGASYSLSVFLGSPPQIWLPLTIR